MGNRKNGQHKQNQGWPEIICMGHTRLDPRAPLRERASYFREKLDRKILGYFSVATLLAEHEVVNAFYLLSLKVSTKNVFVTIS